MMSTWLSKPLTDWSGSV